MPDTQVPHAPGLPLTLMQPTMVVVSAELYCVQSTVEYIRTNLKVDKCITLVKTFYLSSYYLVLHCLTNIFRVPIFLFADTCDTCTHRSTLAEAHPMTEERINCVRKRPSDQPSYSMAWRETDR